MFTYFESYHPRYWPGIEMRGFLRPFTGLRFCQNIMLDDTLKFNRLAAIGGAFDRLQRRLNCPVYIDRLQGGVNIDDYPYDPALLADYRSRLGDKFWGFQMHEWMSNYRSDISKLERGGCTAWTASEIERIIRRDYTCKYLFLEAMLPREMEALGRPATEEEFRRHARCLYESRLASHGELIPCDSYYLAFKYELETMGGRTRRFMPEVGAQTRDSRLQIVYARSMAKAYGVDFGVYYEPWGGDPFSACCYNRIPADNEWGIGQSEDFPFQTMGDNGGSSRSLQWRIHLYSYFSGAAFMSEEWGMCNTFRDWEDYEVTPYGQVKLDFLDLVERHPDRGLPLAPVAVVLPRTLDILQGIHAEDALGYPLEGEAGERLARLRRHLRTVFSNPTPMSGTEAHALINSEVPDAIDLIHADAPTIGDYPYLVDLTDGELPAALRERVIPVETAATVAAEALPCRVVGGVHWMVNACDDGSHRLILFNHNGIMRTVASGEYPLPEATATAIVRIKNGSPLTRLEGSPAVSCEGDTWHIELPPGAWFLGRF